MSRALGVSSTECQQLWASSAPGINSRHVRHQRLVLAAQCVSSTQCQQHWASRALSVSSTGMGDRSTGRQQHWASTALGVTSAWCQQVCASVAQTISRIGRNVHRVSAALGVSSTGMCVSSTGRHQGLVCVSKTECRQNWAPATFGVTSTWRQQHRGSAAQNDSSIRRQQH